MFKSKDMCGYGGDYYSTVVYERFAGCGFFKVRFSLSEAAMKNTAETVNYVVESVFQVGNEHTNGHTSDQERY